MDPVHVRWGFDEDNFYQTFVFPLDGSLYIDIAGNLLLKSSGPTAYTRPELEEPLKISIPLLIDIDDNFVLQSRSVVYIKLKPNQKWPPMPAYDDNNFVYRIIDQPYQYQDVYGSAADRIAKYLRKRVCKMIGAKCSPTYENTLDAIARIQHDASPAEEE